MGHKSNSNIFVSRYTIEEKQNDRLIYRIIFFSRTIGLKRDKKRTSNGLSDPMFQLHHMDEPQMLRKSVRFTLYPLYLTEKAVNQIKSRSRSISDPCYSS